MPIRLSNKERTAVREEVERVIKDAVLNVASVLDLYYIGDDYKLHEGDIFAKRTCYSYLSQRFPLAWGRAVPKSILEHLEKNNTFACTNGEKVYFSLDLFAKQYYQFLEKAEVSVEDFLEDSHHKVRCDVQTVLAHEYTHILMCHSLRLTQFAKKSKSEDNIHTYALACEIEANRGKGVNVSSGAYKIGVTEAAFPEVVGVYGLQNIYETLKRKFGDKIDKVARKFAAEGPQEQNTQKAKGTQKANGTQEQGNSSSTEQSQAQAEPSKNPDEEGFTEAQLEAIKRTVNTSKEALGRPESLGTHQPEETAKEFLEEHNISQSMLESGDIKDIFKSIDTAAMKAQMQQEMGKLKGILSGSDLGINRKPTYSRPSRKESTDGLMKKGIKRGKAKSPTVLIAVDQSGSMQETTSKEVLAAIMEVMRVIGKSMKGSYICLHDVSLHRVSPLKDYKQVAAAFYAGGNNDFEKVLALALQKGVEMVINVGDGLDTLCDPKLLAEFKKRKMRWVDVLISGVSKAYVEDCIAVEPGMIAGRIGSSGADKKAKELRIKRTIIQLK